MVKLKGLAWRWSLEGAAMAEAAAATAQAGAAMAAEARVEAASVVDSQDQEAAVLLPKSPRGDGGGGAGGGGVGGGSVGGGAGGKGQGRRRGNHTVGGPVAPAVSRGLQGVGGWRGVLA